MRPVSILSAMLLALMTGSAAHAQLNLPDNLVTVPDGRATIHQLYESYGQLLQAGWQLDVVARSRPAGTNHAIPIVAFRSPVRGPATWIISGIHGEEPAGPNAIAAVIDDIKEFGRSHPVVLIPLGNPHGYVRNWRYLNVPVWSVGVDAQSVGDSSHLLRDPDKLLKARAATASSPEARAMTRYILDRITIYPPLVSIDLHEDDKISEGYVYSQGAQGAADPLAAEAVRALSRNGIPVKLEGQTRFNEAISNGIVGPVSDSSIDELMSAQVLIVSNTLRPGPAAGTVLVFETPAGELPLARRIEAHAALLRRMIVRISDSDN